MAKTIGKANAAQIKDWKAKHGDVRQFKQEDDDGNTHLTYVRKPTLEDSSYAGSVGGSDGIKIGIAMTNAVWLGGSEAAKEDAQLFKGIMAKVLKLAKPIEAEVTKL